MSVCMCVCVGARLAATKGRKRRGSGGKELGEWAGVLQRGLLSKACSSSFKKSKPVAVGTVKGTGVDAEPTEHSVLRGGGLTPLMSSRMEVGFNCRK